MIDTVFRFNDLMNSIKFYIGQMDCKFLDVGATRYCKCKTLHYHNFDVGACSTSQLCTNQISVVSALDAVMVWSVSAEGMGHSWKGKFNWCFPVRGYLLVGGIRYSGVHTADKLLDDWSVHLCLTKIGCRTRKLWKMMDINGGAWIFRGAFPPGTVA